MIASCLSKRISFIYNDLFPEYSGVNFCRKCNTIIVATNDIFQSRCLQRDRKRWDICPDGIYDSVLLYVDKERECKNRPFFRISVKDQNIIGVIPDKSFIHYHHGIYKDSQSGIYITFENLPRLGFYPIKRKEN